MTVSRGCAIALILPSCLTAQTNSVPDIWSPVRFLVGSWEGAANGQPGSGKSLREYRFVLNDKYLEVRNKSTYPAGPKNPKGEVHEDWGMISYDRSRFSMMADRAYGCRRVEKFPDGGFGQGGRAVGRL